MVSHNAYKLKNYKCHKEGHWERYYKYIEQNCFSDFLSMQCTTICHLAMIAMMDWL